MKPSEIKELMESFRNKQATIAVIGMGYVGLPLAFEAVESGFTVIGIDVDKEKVKSLKDGISYVKDISDATLKMMNETGRFFPSNDYSMVKDAQAISICVPTPLRKTREPDISYIIDAAKSIAQHLKKGQLLVLESTTYPGTTQEIVQPLLESSGLVAGQDFFLAYSPERVDPGNAVYNTRNTPKVVGGISELCTEIGMAYYGAIVDKVVPVGNPREAEMVKLLENTFRSVNIGLVNELALMCHRMDIDIWRVVEAAATKPFGYMPFWPGPGLGGHCIPIDPQYLSWKAKSFNFYTKFIDYAGEINGNMPRFVVTRVQDALNDKAKSCKNSKILICGVAYKPGVNDIRESPALEIMLLLQEKGAILEYHDPFVPALELPNISLKSIQLTPESLKEFDMVLITTNHDCLNYNQLVQDSSLIFDTRNATNGIKSEKVIKL